MPQIELLNYYEIGHGFPLVLLHGWSADGLMYLFQIPLSYRYRLIIPDLRGHGKSPGILGTCSVETLSQDIDHLLTKLDVPKAIICGGSLGGAVALQYTLDHPERVAALIVSDFSANAENSREFLVQCSAMMQGENPLANLRRLLNDLFQSTDLNNSQQGLVFSEGVLERVMDVDPVGLAKVMTGFQSFNIESRLSEIKVPTLILGGRTDTIVPLSALEDMHKQIEHSELVVLNTPHTSRVYAPMGWNRAVKDFLEKRGFSDRHPV